MGSKKANAERQQQILRELSPDGVPPGGQKLLNITTRRVVYESYKDRRARVEAEKRRKRFVPPPPEPEKPCPCKTRGIVDGKIEGIGFCREGKFISFGEAAIYRTAHHLTGPSAVETLRGALDILDGAGLGIDRENMRYFPDGLEGQAYKSK